MPLDPTKHEDTQSDSDNERQLFAAVLFTIDLQHLPFLAEAVRRRVEDSETDPTVSDPIYGSYHILFPLDFNDGVRWLVKIHVNGTPDRWDTMSASAITSEARTMQLLKQETKIPLPEVFDFSSTTHNKLRCPYILMSFIRGVSLYDVWFDKNLVTPDAVCDRRTRVFRGIAAAMVQLEKFSFQRGGAIIFDEDGKLFDIGPMREVDHKVMLDRWFIHGDSDDDPLYVRVGPFSDPKAYYTPMLDHPEAKPFAKGTAMLLRELISRIPEPEGDTGFVLTHPDFDIQNVIVSENGELLGLIDWDGVAAVPRSLGNER
jgi:hypothetical protein